MELTRERRLLFGKGGAYGNTLRIQPPMCLTMEDAKYIVEAFEDAVIHQQRKWYQYSDFIYSFVFICIHDIFYRLLFLL